MNTNNFWWRNVINMIFSQMVHNINKIILKEMKKSVFVQKGCNLVGKARKIQLKGILFFQKPCGALLKFWKIEKFCDDVIIGVPTSIPNLKFVAIANIELWPTGKKRRVFGWSMLSYPIVLGGYFGYFRTA